MPIIKLGKCGECGKRFFCDFDRIDWDGRPIDEQCAKCQINERVQEAEMAKLEQVEYEKHKEEFMTQWQNEKAELKKELDKLEENQDFYQEEWNDRFEHLLPEK